MEADDAPARARAGRHRPAAVEPRAVPRGASNGPTPTDPLVRQELARLETGYRLGRLLVLRETLGQAPRSFSAATKTLLHRARAAGGRLRRPHASAPRPRCGAGSPAASATRPPTRSWAARRTCCATSSASGCSGLAPRAGLMPAGRRSRRAAGRSGGAGPATGRPGRRHPARRGRHQRPRAGRWPSRSRAGGAAPSVGRRLAARWLGGAYDWACGLGRAAAPEPGPGRAIGLGTGSTGGGDRVGRGSAGEAVADDRRTDDSARRPVARRRLASCRTQAGARTALPASLVARRPTRRGEHADADDDEAGGERGPPKGAAGQAGYGRSATVKIGSTDALRPEPGRAALMSHTP